MKPPCRTGVGFMQHRRTYVVNGKGFLVSRLGAASMVRRAKSVNVASWAARKYSKVRRRSYGPWRAAIGGVKHMKQGAEKDLGLAWWQVEKREAGEMEREIEIKTNT